MTDRYRAAGKEVLRGREHVADAADETYAQIIADALNGERAGPVAMEQIVPDDPYSFVAVDPVFLRPINHPLKADELHRVTQRPDGDYHCSCGRGWDRDEGDDCPGETS
jgi:hypothetical protein